MSDVLTLSGESCVTNPMPHASVPSRRRTFSPTWNRGCAEARSGSGSPCFTRMISQGCSALAEASAAESCFVSAERTLVPPTLRRTSPTWRPAFDAGPEGSTVPTS